MSFINKAQQFKVIPVIALDDPQDSIKLGQVLKDNGLPVAEVVLRTKEALAAITLMKKHHPEIYIGAGTVKNADDAQLAYDAGADFIVAPGLNPNTVKKCQELGIEIVPGVNNPSSIELALELNLTNLKFFPAEASGGISMIKSLLAPYADITLMPTGGINAKNIKDYLSVNQVIACGGTWMVDKKLINEGKWDEIGRLTREAVAMVAD